jgi:hypothetical protein
VRATFRRGNQFQEVDTFNRPLRLVHGPDANGADRNAQLRVARRAAIGPAEATWLALIVALVAWAVSGCRSIARSDELLHRLSVRGEGQCDLQSLHDRCSESGRRKPRHVSQPRQGSALLSAREIG